MVEETRRIAGVSVRLTWPISNNHDSDDNSSNKASSPKGVAFLLPGAMIGISEYNGLRDVILERQYLVVSTYINVLWPVCNNHRKHAQDVKKVFNELCSIHSNLPGTYTVVGHSAGGKIALLLASIIDSQRVQSVLALDPVDITPTEFSNATGENLPLNDDIGEYAPADEARDEECVHVVHRKEKHIPIIMTCTDGGRGIPKNHNANAIHKLHPGTICYRHAHAGHMAYCDHGGGRWAGYAMPDIGTRKGNEEAKASAHNLIRQILSS